MDLLTREEAAAYLRCSLSTFKVRWQSKLKPMRPEGGRKILYDKEDLESCLALLKGGLSTGSKTLPTSASGTRVTVTISPRAKEIRKKLAA